jgi:hypothetical protein
MRFVGQKMAVGLGRKPLANVHEDHCALFGHVTHGEQVIAHDAYTQAVIDGTERLTGGKHVRYQWGSPRTNAGQNIANRA